MIMIKFGGVIQTLLTKTDYTETSDRFMIETDAANLNNHLFRRLVYVPQVINLISAKPMPQELLTRLINCNGSPICTFYENSFLF